MSDIENIESKFKVGDKVVRTKHFETNVNTFLKNVHYTVSHINDKEQTLGLYEVPTSGLCPFKQDNFELANVQEKGGVQPTKTGGSTPNQYRLSVNLPLTSDRTQFVDVDLEAMDVIDALDLSGNLKDVQKALFRMGKKENTSISYDLNKCLFYILREMKKRGNISHAKFWEASQVLERVLDES